MPAPLHGAARQGHVAVVGLLLDARIEPRFDAACERRVRVVSGLSTPALPRGVPRKIASEHQASSPPQPRKRCRVQPTAYLSQIWLK
jgi:ankyrin repeat protein